MSDTASPATSRDRENPHDDEKSREEKAPIIEVLAEFFGVRRSQIELIAGMTSRDKKFFVGVSAVEAARKIETIGDR